MSGTVAGAAAAQDYPSRPIHVVIGFAAGSGADILTRFYANKLAEVSGQSTVVENRPGAIGMIAATVVTKAKPDGYTVLLTTNGLAISPSLYRTLPFDVHRDFIPVTQLVASQLVLTATPKLAASSVAELIALAKSTDRAWPCNAGSSTFVGSRPRAVAMRDAIRSAGSRRAWASRSAMIPNCAPCRPLAVGTISRCGHA